MSISLFGERMARAAVFLVALFVATIASAGENSRDREMRNDNGGIRFVDGRLEILGADGKPVFRFGDLTFGWSPPVARPDRVEWVDENTFRIVFAVDKDDTGTVAVALNCALTDRGVRCDYVIAAPESVKTGGIGQFFTPVDGTAIRDMYKAGVWARHPGGGVPRENRDIYLKPFIGKTARVYLDATGNPWWSRNRRVHVPLTKGADGTLRSAFEFFILPADTRDIEAAAIARERPLALSLETDRYSNIFEDGAPSFRVVAGNTGEADLDGVELSVVAYNYDGERVLEEKRVLALPTGKRAAHDFTLPAAPRQIYFVEASAKRDGTEYFTRTHVAALPPHKYEHMEDSRIGIARFFHDDEAEKRKVYALLHRMGVRYFRGDDNSKTRADGFISFNHVNNVKREFYDPEKDRKQLMAIVDSVEKQESPLLEFGNEWASHQKTEIKQELAEKQVSWLKPLRAELDRRGLKTKLLCTSLGGAGDIGFIQNLYDAGAWPLIDGIPFHAGRGFFTADHGGDGWRYKGSIQKVRKKMRELGGDKELHLTEVYACTVPNNWWRDSLRQAADAALLTLAIAYAEDAKTVFFFEMHHGIGFDPKGVHDTDPEYDFGLMLRDHAPKPAFMAFCAAAEALDGAVFRRYLSLPGTRVEGMEFDTPRGKMAILYDRTEGYAHPNATKRSPDFVHTEGWIDQWQKPRTHVFAAAGDAVEVVDVIGRATRVAAVDGKATLTLDGSPRVVYGLVWPE